MRDPLRDIRHIVVADIKTPAEGVATLGYLADLEWEYEYGLKEIGKLRHELETQKLVELFDDAGMTGSHSFGDLTVKKGLDVTGSLPKPGEKDSEEVASAKLAKRLAALDWLHANGYGPMIKASVTLEWDKGDAHKADAVVEQYRGDNSVKMKRTDDIHASTLKSQARKRYESGLETPFDTLGITILPAVLLTKKPNRKDT
jgi:hypothetical protein